MTTRCSCLCDGCHTRELTCYPPFRLCALFSVLSTTFTSITQPVGYHSFGSLGSQPPKEGDGWGWGQCSVDFTRNRRPSRVGVLFWAPIGITRELWLPHVLINTWCHPSFPLWLFQHFQVIFLSYIYSSSFCKPHHCYL